MATWPVHGRIDGPIVMIGFGSIGRGTLPLIERHFTFDKDRFVVVDPSDKDRRLLDERGIRFVQTALTHDNYRAVLTPLLTAGRRPGFLRQPLGRHLVAGHHGALRASSAASTSTRSPSRGPASTSTRARGRRRAPTTPCARRSSTLRRATPGGPTAVSCCGANPGMVSWFVKQALLNIAADTGHRRATPKSREEWARLMQRVGVKGIHIAERDTQRATSEKPMGVFVNTWSVEGFVSEGMQPAELGWGTHETWMPDKAGRQGDDTPLRLYLLQPGANTRVRSWCPTPGPQYGFLVTHNESISIADFFTLRENGRAVYRPTCHYAYHPCNEAVLSLHEMFGQAGQVQDKHHILDEDEIVDGIDELGVLLYGHAKNAYWYGSQLSIEETRRIAPYQNATGLQVTSAVLAGMVWALENPKAGIVEADEIDFRRCLEVQTPYLGPVKGFYTDWTPLDGPPRLLPGGHRQSDPWQFRNVLVR